jgi:hypothetical protein
MKCVWTQKVSLLIDGELERAEAREVEQHLAACGDCREAQADFLSLRRQIADYTIELDAFAKQRALKSILAAGANGAKMETDRRAGSRGRAGRFAGLFGMPRLSPVGLAALLLLLFGVAVGLIALTNARRPSPEIAHNVPTPAPSNEVRSDANGNAQAASPSTSNNPAATTNSGVETNGGETSGGRVEKETGGTLATGTGSRAPRSNSSERAPRIEHARRKVKKPSPTFNAPNVDVPILETANNNAEAVENVSGDNGDTIEASDAGDELLTRRVRGITNDSKTARHVEQAQLLLRSFRNARLADAGRRASSDLAYDKRQSKKLLYQNIVLRREAARGGKPEVESTLTQLEPILLDIANLPDKPASEDVRSIKNRMERKNIVAMLQVAARD